MLTTTSTKGTVSTSQWVTTPVKVDNGPVIGVIAGSSAGAVVGLVAIVLLVRHCRRRQAYQQLA